MATFNIRPITPVRYFRDERFLNRRFAAGQSFVKGTPVVLNPTGTISEIGVDGAVILGFSTAGTGDYDWRYDSFGYVNRGCPVARADQEFRGTLLGVFAAADVGTAYGLVEHASGYWTVDKAETLATRVRITGVDNFGIDANPAPGDTNVPVTFIVLPANRQED